MTQPSEIDDLLDLPTRRASRLVALLQLGRLAETHARLSDPEDLEALHDFRVAIRRLRSWIRAFHAWLEESVPRKLRRRLRDLAAATSVSRDAEVHIAWIAEQRPKLTPRQRTGAAWLQERLASAKVQSDAELQRKIAARFSRIHVALECAMGEYTMRVNLYDGPRDLRFSRAVARLMREHATELRDRLERVHSSDHSREAHRARIAGKSLRYLLEPITGYAPAAGALVERLKELQDALGDVNDARVFAGELTAALEDSASEHARVLSRSVLAGKEKGGELRRARRRDPRPGLVALARLLRERGAAAFARVEREWLGDASGPFFADVEALAGELERRPAAGIEIERKYLLSGLPPRSKKGAVAEIRQGYLPGRRLVERLRHVREDSGDRWVRTVKGGMGLTRLEVEEETTESVFTRMWPLTKGRRLTKRRYTIADAGHTWEIDEFTDRNLVLAEVELPDPDTPVEIPTWLAPHVVREVTGEQEYANATLAR